MQRTRDEAAGGPRSESGVEECTGTDDERDRVSQRTDRVHGKKQISRSKGVEANQGSGNADRSHLHVDAGRSTSFSQELGCSLLRGAPTWKAQLGTERAHHVLGPWGVDSDLRRWGMKLAEHGGKRRKKRAVIAVARKLAVPLHRLWGAEMFMCHYSRAVGPHCRRSHSSVQIYGGFVSEAEFR